MKGTRGNLKKMETLFDEIGYVIRYEKGNFNSGYCLVENRNVAVLNKFYDTDARFTVLIDILNQLEFATGNLSEESETFLQKLEKAGQYNVILEPQDQEPSNSK